MDNFVLAQWTEPNITHKVVLQVRKPASEVPALHEPTPLVPLNEGTIVHRTPRKVKNNIPSFRRAREKDPCTINQLPLKFKKLQQSLYALRVGFPRDFILHHKNCLYMFPECKGMSLSECIERVIGLSAASQTQSSPVQPVFFLTL
jgi:hypothetical protein